MFRKITLTLLMTLISIAGTGYALAQTADAEAENAKLMAAFANEGPLTETDIQTFIKIAPALLEAVDANDETRGLKLMEEAGWGEIRGAYVTSKIGNGYMMLTDAEDAQTLFELVEMPASLIPGESEMAVITKYQADLAKIFD